MCTGKRIAKGNKQKSCISFHKNIILLFVLTEGRKPACLKIKTSAPPSTCQPNSRLRCGSSRCTCKGPVTPCYSWRPQKVSLCLEQCRENRHKDKPLRYKRSTKQQSCANAALQPEGCRYQVGLPSNPFAQEHQIPIVLCSSDCQAGESDVSYRELELPQRRAAESRHSH